MKFGRGSPTHPPGTVAFVVRTNEKELSLDDVIFEYYKAPSILFADPSSGPQPSFGSTAVTSDQMYITCVILEMCMFLGNLLRRMPSSTCRQ